MNGAAGRRRAVPASIAVAAGFVRAVIASVTWRALLTVSLLGLLLNVSRQLKFSEGVPPHYFAAGTVITQLGALCMLLAVLTADEAVQRGARAWLAYPVALLAASIVTAVGQWYIRGWLHLYTVINQPGIALRIQYTMIIFVACDVMTFGGFAMLAYVNRRSAQRILEGVRSAELKRVQTERRLMDSRLATARAHIDPQMLFGSLTEVRDLYQQGAAAAGPELDALIQRLQAAVTSNTVATAPGKAAR